uniref:Interleukin-6 n=1 Tax=Sciurus vulgaris TaxID=55149 RepID=A0A8D2JNZ9_SCIVU
MKFFSSAFLPVAFLGLLLVVATAFPTSELPREDVEEGVTSNKPMRTTSDKTGEQISYLIKEVFELRKQLCKNDETCIKSQVAVSENNLNLPKMTEKDGCFQTGYNRDNCLVRITSGLLEFQIYLKYIQNKFQDSKDNDRAQHVQYSSKALIEILKEEVKNPDKIILPSPTANASLMEKLESQNDWQKIMTIQLILSSLEDFLQFTMRAVRKA